MKTREEIDQIMRNAEKKGTAWESVVTGVIIALLLDIRDLLANKEKE